MCCGKSIEVTMEDVICKHVIVKEEDYMVIKEEEVVETVEIGKWDSVVAKEREVVGR